MMTPFDHKSQNTSGFGCLMLIRAIVIFTPLEIQNLNKKRKKRNSYSCRQITLTWQLPIVYSFVFGTGSEPFTLHVRRVATSPKF